MPTLNELRLTGAVEAHVKGFKSGKRLRLDLSGAVELEGELEVTLHARRVRPRDASSDMPAAKWVFGRWSYAISAADRRALAYDCRLPLEHDFSDQQLGRNELFASVQLHSDGRTIRSLERPLRIDLSATATETAKKPSVSRGASSPDYVEQTPLPPR